MQVAEILSRGYGDVSKAFEDLLTYFAEDSKKVGCEDFFGSTIHSFLKAFNKAVTQNAERQALEANHGASIEILNGKVATLEAELIERASMLDRTSQELTTARSDHAAMATSLEVAEAQLHHEKEVADARAREAADALGRLEAAAAEKLAAAYAHGDAAADAARARARGRASILL